MPAGAWKTDPAHTFEMNYMMISTVRVLLFRYKSAIRHVYGGRYRVTGDLAQHFAGLTHFPPP